MDDHNKDSYDARIDQLIKFYRRRKKMQQLQKLIKADQINPPKKIKPFRSFSNE